MALAGHSPVHSTQPERINTMSETDKDQTPAYIARCKCGCRGIVMCTVDRPEHAVDVAKEVADCIRDGLTVEHVTVGYVHEFGFGCEVENALAKLQPALFETQKA
jgi:Ethanolamine utilization protein EutJ (predicted chaperonin)